MIVSQGIESHSFIVKVAIHTYTASFSLSLARSHMWTLDELHFSENILKRRSLNCKLDGVFRKQARLSTVERGESVHAHGCQVDKDKDHT